MSISKSNLSFGLIVLLLGALAFNIFRYKQLTEKYNKLATQYNAISKSINDKNDIITEKNKVKLAKGDVFKPINVLNTNNQEINVPNSQNNKKMLVFSSVSCPNCDNFHPVLNDFSKTHKNIDITVMQYDATLEEQKEALKNYTFNLTRVEGHILDTLNVLYTPTTIILNNENQVDTVIVSALNLKELETVYNSIAN